VTEAEFRKLARAHPETEERSHMGHPDFRVRGKVFATLRYPRRGFGMLAVSPEDQAVLMKLQPASFSPAAGAWGRNGSTIVALKAAKRGLVAQALADAWRNKAPDSLVREMSESVTRRKR
jgi:hypothetical protein